jgi:diaminohydroxyphosphoribosylaminopyrimidine deaminase/5-amino-6-(5-phosphoribosylamino)uracil reductase
VTLEPCSHYGRTPPCCNTISKNKIPNVVIGTVDNSNKVNGRGIEFLKQNNINVINGVLENKCKELHKNFLYFNKNKRPYIILKWAQSNDKLFSPLKKIKNRPFWISSKKSRQLVHKWRSEEHAILVGYNTVVHDNPNLNVRNWKGKNPIRIVVDIENKLNNKFKVFSDQAKTITITKDNIDSSIHIASEISSFLFKKNIQSVIVEGGKKTLDEFIKTNLWDEARIFTNNKNLKIGIEAPKLNGKIILEKKIDDDDLKIMKPL